LIKLTRLLVSLFLLLGFSGMSFAAEPLTIKFATVAPEGSTWMNTMKEIDKVIREKTQGQIAFRVYAGGVAGDELDALRKIRIGQLQSAAFSGVGFGQILPAVRVLDLPFLFMNYKEIDLVHKELEGFFAEQFRQKDFELLSWAEVGNVHLFSQEPIRKVGDLAKLKVWTWSGDPIAKETFSAMGTNPVPLAITDVTTALNTGMIDTVYAPPLGAIALQWNLSVKYMTSLPLAHSTGAILVSKNFSQKIPAEHFKIVKDEFHRSMERLTLELRKQTEESVALLEKGGIKILPAPQEADLKEFYKVHDRVAHALTGKVYPKDVLDKVYDILKKNR
jgi:TRAP-type C4-dicarboxylate transport system substrate-binding protein